jgi:hypothetical protein
VLYSTCTSSIVKYCCTKSRKGWAGQDMGDMQDTYKVLVRKKPLWLPRHKLGDDSNLINIHVLKRTQLFNTWIFVEQHNRMSCIKMYQVLTLPVTHTVHLCTSYDTYMKQWLFSYQLKLIGLVMEAHCLMCEVQLNMGHVQLKSVCGIAV